MNLSLKQVKLLIFILCINSNTCHGIIFPFKSRKASQIGIHFDNQPKYRNTNNEISKQISSRMSSGPRNKLVVKSQQHKMKGRKPKQMVLLISILDTITDSENSSSSSVVESALSGMDLKEKVKYGFVEGLLNEVVNGLLQSDVMASPFPMHTMLMDLSMCAWTTWQNYQLSRELMTDEAVTACSLPSVAISGTPLNGAEGSLSADTKLSTESTGRSLLQYALMTLLVNVVSHELLPMALHAAEGAVQQVIVASLTRNE